MTLRLITAALTLPRTIPQVMAACFRLLESHRVAEFCVLQGWRKLHHRATASLVYRCSAVTLLSHPALECQLHLLAQPVLPGNSAGNGTAAKYNYPRMARARSASVAAGGRQESPVSGNAATGASHASLLAPDAGSGTYLHNTVRCLVFFSNPFLFYRNQRCLWGSSCSSSLRSVWGCVCAADKPCLRVEACMM